jgi:DNA modification methylase
MIDIMQGDCLAALATLPSASVHTCVTSPPYFGLRDYGHAGQIGLEDTPEAFVGRLVDVFREVRRVLRDDGTLWLNLGDSYAASGGVGQPHRDSSGGIGNKGTRGQQGYHASGGGFARPNTAQGGLKPKDLIGIPWRVAFALQADGWYLRQDIIWHKPNPMPESVRDRCTKAHEYIFLLSKGPSYHFDHEAMQEMATNRPPGNKKPTKGGRNYEAGADEHRTAANLHNIGARETRNRRSVWTVTTKPFKGAHFATFPPDLIEPCVLAGAPVGGTVLDPFFGAGTTGLVAAQHGRRCIGIELNPDYIAIARQRLGLFASGSAA